MAAKPRRARAELPTSRGKSGSSTHPARTPTAPAKLQPKPSKRWYSKGNQTAPTPSKVPSTPQARGRPIAHAQASDTHSGTSTR